MVPGSLSRPTDMFLPSWSCGRPAALDIHVISPPPTDSRRDLSLSRPCTPDWSAAQACLKSSCLSRCWSAMQTLCHRNTWGTGSGCHSYHLPFATWVRQVWIFGPFCLSKASFPEICDLSLAGQCLLHRHPTLSPTLDGIA